MKTQKEKKKHPFPANLIFAGHERLSGNVLEQDLRNADPKNPFYNRTVVFTGVLEKFSRTEAAAKVQKMGADINKSVSDTTDYVIMGADAGPAKIQKIEIMQSKGSKIRVVSETEFLEMLNTLYETDYTPPSLKEIYDTHKDEWERLGWHTESDDTFIGLYKNRKNGTHLKYPTICIGYEGTTYDYTDFSDDGESANISKAKQRPWYVCCKGQNTITYKSVDNAIDRFLEDVKNYQI
ncbi:hypothetical protein AGMMS49525_18200 [Bacteroidia bacterium]|nr:hypothetical protein AGMMS49525_18200 [Bacteroidia bacterium]